MKLKIAVSVVCALLAYELFNILTIYVFDISIKSDLATYCVSFGTAFGAYNLEKKKGCE